jgi:hypothetical protein
MRSLAAALDLAFEEVLLTPTVFAEPARANSSFDRRFGAVDAGAVNDWQARIAEGQPWRESRQDHGRTGIRLSLGGSKLPCRQRPVAKRREQLRPNRLGNGCHIICRKLGDQLVVDTRLHRNLAGSGN